MKFFVVDIGIPGWGVDAYGVWSESESAVRERHAAQHPGWEVRTVTELDAYADFR